MRRIQRLPWIEWFGKHNGVGVGLEGLVAPRKGQRKGLVSKECLVNKMSWHQGVRSYCKRSCLKLRMVKRRRIASKSPLAVIGTKNVLIKSRDMSVQQGLDYVATWNSSMLLSDDLKEVISAQKQKRKPSFSKLDGTQWGSSPKHTSRSVDVFLISERVTFVIKQLIQTMKVSKEFENNGFCNYSLLWRISNMSRPNKTFAWLCGDDEKVIQEIDWQENPVFCIS
ncbi:delta(3,5)-delta(2,4)-dienoyl-CoA isomerase, peroxisomal [Tanacetum coccineum]